MKKLGRQFGTALAGNLAYGTTPVSVPLHGATDVAKVSETMGAGIFPEQRDTTKFQGLHWGGKMLLNIPYNKPS